MSVDLFYNSNAIEETEQPLGVGLSSEKVAKSRTSFTEENHFARSRPPARVILADLDPTRLIGVRKQVAMESLKAPLKKPTTDPTQHGTHGHEPKPHFPTEAEVWNRSNAVKVLDNPEKTPRNRRKKGTNKRNDVAERKSMGVNWPVTGWLIVVHLGALAAPFTFTWQALVVTFVLHWFAGGVGICLGFHRLLTHGSFQTYRIVKYFLATVGMLGGEGSPIDWVANHRKHHALSDDDGDPHSPRDGAWWSHALWISYDLSTAGHRHHIKHWAPDLAKDPVMRIIGKFFIPIHFFTAALLYGLGYYLGGNSMGISMVVWGLFVRMVFVMHSTWFVNSASHMFGYRNYETTDDSGNVWWVALVTYGEGWHNNHHAYPRMALHGHKWWEFDITYNTIRLMKLFGLAWDIVDYKHKKEKVAA